MQAPLPNRGLPLLGQMLVERGLVTEAQLDDALARQRERGKRLGESLVDLGCLTRAQLYSVLAERSGVEFFDLTQHTIDPVLAALVPERVARRFQAIPVAQRPGEIVVAMDSPEDVFELDDLSSITGATIVPMLADPEELALAIDRAYSGADISASVQAAVDDVDDQEPLHVMHDMADGAVIRLVDTLLEQAVTERASDVHIDPAADNVRLRIRVDGVLRDVSHAPSALLRPLISRVKVMAGLDIASTRVPQDGRFTFELHGREIDVRLATLPSSRGESAVLRLLDTARGIIALPALGFRDAELARFASAFRAPQGAVIVSGPTGAGKTSTLYATINEVNTPSRAIVSVEDPIEYEIDGVKQVQINPKAGLTFATALRSVLRNDPDVILVGEVRDRETAQIAAEASITGHLVFSTIHTTSAAAVPMRLIEMGVEPYLVASALSCIVAQRLARRLCPHCAVEVRNPDLSVLHRNGWVDASLTVPLARQAVGCEICHDTGYQGRVAIYEVMPVSADIRALISREAPTAEIERVAVAEGMDTLRAAALNRLVDGDIGLDEMLRVVA